MDAGRAPAADCQRQRPDHRGFGRKRSAQTADHGRARVLAALVAGWKTIALYVARSQAADRGALGSFGGRLRSASIISRLEPARLRVLRKLDPGWRHIRLSVRAQWAQRDLGPAGAALVRGRPR